MRGKKKRREGEEEKCDERGEKVRVRNEEIRLCIFFFFKQKTAYEIGTGDWSSDVCSSDLQSRFFYWNITEYLAKLCIGLSPHK